MEVMFCDAHIMHDEERGFVLWMVMGYDGRLISQMRNYQCVCIRESTRAFECEHNVESMRTQEER